MLVGSASTAAWPPAAPAAMRAIATSGSIAGRRVRHAPCARLGLERGIDRRGIARAVHPFMHRVALRPAGLAERACGAERIGGERGRTAISSSERNIVRIVAPQLHRVSSMQARMASRSSAVMTRGVCRAVQYLHGAMLHRDVQLARVARDRGFEIGHRLVGASELPMHPRAHAQRRAVVGLQPDRGVESVERLVEPLRPDQHQAETVLRVAVPRLQPHGFFQIAQRLRPFVP